MKQHQQWLQLTQKKMCRAAFMALSLQDKITVFEKAFQTGMAASDGPAASEAADLLLTMLPLFKDMISWTVKGIFPHYLPSMQILMPYISSVLEAAMAEGNPGAHGYAVCMLYIFALQIAPARGVDETYWGRPSSRLP